MPLGNSRNFVPKGQDENSPAFQRRVAGNQPTSPAGTAEMIGPLSQIQPSLRDSKPPGTFPGVETPGYSHSVPPGTTFPELPKRVGQKPALQRVRKLDDYG